MNWTDAAFLLSAIAVIVGGCVLLWYGFGRRKKFTDETIDEYVRRYVRRRAIAGLTEPKAEFWRLDPTLSELNAQITKAKRQHKKRSHLEAAKTARVHELLWGSGSQQRASPQQDAVNNAGQQNAAILNAESPYYYDPPRF